MTTLQEYYKLLKQHDWYYAWSDDGGIYAEGAAERVKIEKIASQSEAHKALLMGFVAHYFPSENEEKKPLPEEPAAN